MAEGLVVSVMTSYLSPIVPTIGVVAGGRRLGEFLAALFRLQAAPIPRDPLRAFLLLSQLLS